MSQNDQSNTNIPPVNKIVSKSKLESFSKNGENWVEVQFPLITVSEANGGPKKTVIRKGKKYTKGEHWTDKHKRHKKQKGVVYMVLRKYSTIVRIPCKITLTRFAPCKLDRHDNLPMSLKWVLDACCSVITGDYRPGRADDSEEIEVNYKQIQCNEYFVNVRLDW